MDFTTTFDHRLEALHAARNCPTKEIDAAVAIFERLKTTQSICASLLGDTADHTVLTAVFSELCTEARRGQDTRTEE
jgi:tRNA U34 5-carboxymethylaminomethyl modifying GTPase MnmE/TrmE